MKRLDCEEKITVRAAVRDPKDPCDRQPKAQGGGHFAIELSVRT